MLSFCFKSVKVVERFSLTALATATANERITVSEQQKSKS